MDVLAANIAPDHGGLDLAELRALGLEPSEVVDFRASVNPLGVSPLVARALADVDPSVYPDRECILLREALAAKNDCPVERILVGNGSTELIHLIARASLGATDPALVFGPTFGEYEASITLNCATMHWITADEGNGFHWDIDEAIETIRLLAPKLVFLCNLNNPTGVLLDEESVGKVADAVGLHGILVVDQAYLPFVPDGWNSDALVDRDNVVVLRSMTKDHALAGLRVGYLMATEQFIERVEGYQPSWSVNAYAQAAALASLADDEHVQRAREVVVQAKSYLEAVLPDMGIPVLPSAANFLLAKVGDATTVRLNLLKLGICVRDCSSFGLPTYIRIGMRKLDDCQRMVTALQEVMIGPVGTATEQHVADGTDAK